MKPDAKSEPGGSGHAGSRAPALCGPPLGQREENRVRIGVVVVHFAGPRSTEAALASIRRDPSDVERRIVVVDNSPVGRQAFVPDPGSGILRVACPSNPGFGAGANRGVDVLLQDRTPYRGFIILNHDVEIEPGFLAAAARCLGHRIGAAGGPISRGRDMGGPLWYAGGSVRWLTGTVRQEESRVAAQRRRVVGFIPGAAIAISADAWQGVGGFDPRFFLYNEDLDLCLRLRRAGWRLLFEPGMAAVHRLGAASGSARRSPLYLRSITSTRLLPFRSRLYRLYLAILHTPYVLLRALAAVLREGSAGRSRAGALLRGHREALRTVWKRPSSVSTGGRCVPG